MQDLIVKLKFLDRSPPFVSTSIPEILNKALLIDILIIVCHCMAICQKAGQIIDYRECLL